MQGVDLDLFRDIPGYKAILKAVLKSQIQVLVEQLSQQTGEESVLLTASIEEGTLSHLGSNTGRFFIDGHSDIKSQFLGFCLKRHQITQQQSEPVLSGNKRKRGPYTKRRQQNSNREPKPTVRNNDVPDPQFTNVVNTAPVSQKSRNLSKRSKPNLAFNFPSVQKAERLKSLPAPSRSKLNIKTEPDNFIEIKMAEDNDIKLVGPVKREQTMKTERTIKSEKKWSMDTESPYEENYLKFSQGEIGNQSESTENQSQEGGVIISSEAENQSVNIVGQSKLDVNQSESGNQPLEECDEEESISFTVVTEAGDRVFQGRLDDEDENKSLQINGTDPPPETRSADLTINDDLDLDLYLTSENIGSPTVSLMSKPKPDLDLDLFITSENIDDTNVSDVTSKPKPKFPRKPVRSANKTKTKAVLGAKKQSKDKKMDSTHSADYNSRPYPCTMCAKRFKERHHLTYHLRTHSGQRPYVCEICNKAFTQTSSLNVHRRTHENDVDCSACGQTFRGILGFSKHPCYTGGPSTWPHTS